MASIQSVVSSAFVAAALVCASATGAYSASAHRDLADQAAGEYDGDIISDARGSSQSDVHITVAKTGPNRVSVTADNERIPARTFKLTRAMDTIQNSGGNEVFLLDLSKSPHSLSLTIDDASWSGAQAPD